MEFQDGKPVSIHWYSNHSSFRKVGTYQDDFAMPALLYEIEMDLFTVATAEKYAAAHNLKVEDLKLTAEFWFVFFGEEDSDLVYTVYLNQEYFSKEDVIKLAESIQIIPQTSVRVQESSAEETHKITDYLAAYAVDSYENEYIKMDAVEGLSYVVGVNGISIYNQDYYCGWFGTRDFMQVKLREDWQDALQLEYILDSMGLGKSGYVELLDYQTTDNVERYVYEGGIRPFDYADREWLVGSGIFASEKSADEEVCVEEVVLFGAAHMDKGYSFSLNQTLVTEGKLWKLVDAVSFKENAFTAVNAGEIHFSEETVPSMYSVGPEVIQREFAKSLAYDIQVGTLTYHVPEHTVALKSRELTWELYAYDGSDGRWVGTVYAGPTLEVEKAAGEAGSHRRQKKYVRFKWCQEKIYPGNSDVKRRHGDDKSIHGRFGLIV